MCDILSRISVFQAFDIFSVVDVLEGVRQKLQVNVRIQNTIILCNKLEKNVHYLSVNEALQGQQDYMYVPNLINFSKPIYRCIEEEEAMSLSVFFCCNCAFFSCHPSLGHLSPFLPSYMYVTVSRPSCFLELYPNRA